MHILIVNDDGPPSQQSSPYVHSLVQTLQSHGHIISVVLPHTQRSWIGKAHIIGQTVKPTYFRPGTLHQDNGTTHSRPLPPSSSEYPEEEWVLVDGTPASCVQIGLYHYFQEKGPVDLVVSGPNFGRNSTAVFSLSSGTLGGALEAAVCRRRAIALSYAFFSKEKPGVPDSAHDPAIIKDASELSARLIEHLYANWGEDVDLYSVNVPLVEGVQQRKVLWTNMLQNYWGAGSCFKEIEDEEGDAAEEEQRIREGEVEGAPAEGEEKGVTRHTHKHFKWAPRFVDVYKSVEEAGPGNDGWAVKEHYTSVTPLKANFMHAKAQTEGEIELKLPSQFTSTTTSTPSEHTQEQEQSQSSPLTTNMDKFSLTPQPQVSPPTPNEKHIYALINYEDDYVQPLIFAALEKLLPFGSYTLISSPDSLPTPSSPFLQISQYESLPFDFAMSNSSTALINSYVIRKALIRKHYLAVLCRNWVTKHPESILARAFKNGVEFEVDYAEFLDDALVEAWELKESWGRNLEGDEREDGEREWWILKPGMSDRGQGIRLFSSESELQGIFDEWEAERPESDDEDEDEDESNRNTRNGNETDGKGYITTSHLRHFIAQPYIHPPLLLPPPSGGGPTKFHIRTYVLCVGSLKIYVYKDMLALFAGAPYIPPWKSTTSEGGAIDLSPHLTNTCLQTSRLEEGETDGTEQYNPVQTFGSLDLVEEAKDKIFEQICEVTGEVFKAAAKDMMIHFQTLPNAFEVFGLDFLVDANHNAWLLEVNAFPDFKQSGDNLTGLVGGFWEEVVRVAVGGFFGVGEGKGIEKGSERLVCVGDVDLGRR